MTRVVAAPRTPRTSRATPTLLGVWAHPDDEAYLSAGLLATAADRGWRVVVATATRGEAGIDGWPSAEVAAVRERELADSLAALGVADHRWLSGTRRLVDGCLAGVPDDEGAGMVAALLDDVAPDLVVTFGPDGFTGHADHQAVSRWTTAAWERTGARGELWYVALTPDFLDRWGRLCADQRVWMTDAPPAPAAPGDLVHVQACSGDLLARKYAALRAHRSQTAGLIARVGEQRYREWWSTEAFVSASTAAAAGLEEVA